MTAKIRSSTAHAARVCEPKNRDARPSRCGLFRIRITVKVMMPASTPTAKQVLDEPDKGPVPDAGDREGPAEQVAVGLDDRQQQHDETPEGGRVGRPRDRPFQQLALPDHLGRLRFHVQAGVLPDRGDPLRRGLPAERQPLEPPHPAPGHSERDYGQDQADSHPQDHANLLSIRSSSVAT